MSSNEAARSRKRRTVDTAEPTRARRRAALPSDPTFVCIVPHLAIARRPLLAERRNVLPARSRYTWSTSAMPETGHGEPAPPRDRPGAARIEGGTDSLAPAQAGEVIVVVLGGEAVGLVEPRVVYARAGPALSARRKKRPSGGIPAAGGVLEAVGCARTASLRMRIGPAAGPFRRPWRGGSGGLGGRAG